MSEQEQSIEQLRFDAQAVITRVAENIAGHSLDGGLENAKEYLAKSPGIGARAETDFPQLEALTDEQQAEIRTEAAKIGIGAENSTGLKEAGLPEGTTVITEGGLPNKMMAQLKMVAENERKPGLIILSASQTRVAGKLDAARMEQVASMLEVNTPDTTDKTEFELAEITAGLYPDFTATEPRDLGLGYETHDGGITPVSKATGQIMHIGDVKGFPVILVGVKELHRDDSGKNFFRPGVAHMTELAQEITGIFNPEADDVPVATVTSNLYGPSRRLQNPNTLTYGTKVMEDVVGEAAALPSIQNVISEIDRSREVLLEQAK